MVNNIIEERLAQEAIPMCKHIVDIEWINYMCYEIGFL